VNGTAAVATDGAILVTVAQAYGNCPKYIQRREPVEVRPAPPDPTRVARHRALTATARVQIARADTFFLATAHPTDGTDVSHRGGRPGFVEVASDTRLVWPDYQGNMMFMSLGNVAVHPFAGLLFVDFETGDVLQLTGRAAIDWDAAHAAAVPGAERLVTFDVDEVIAAPAASPLRWRLVGVADQAANRPGSRSSSACGAGETAFFETRLAATPSTWQGSPRTHDKQAPARARRGGFPRSQPPKIDPGIFDGPRGAALIEVARRHGASVVGYALDTAPGLRRAQRVPHRPRARPTSRSSRPGRFEARRS
jgi:hypothetical protein